MTRRFTSSSDKPAASRAATNSLKLPSPSSPRPGSLIPQSARVMPSSWTSAYALTRCNPGNGKGSVRRKMPGAGSRRRWGDRVGTRLLVQLLLDDEPHAHQHFVGDLAILDGARHVLK